ncbi:MAG: hypothetical protein NTY45_10320 [Elusimicrobia bacterium]|nr:hypothetical protein [Elusimicrobiota bacterium]
MKRIILAAGLICAGAAFAKAEVSIVAFDIPGYGGLSSYIAARAELESKNLESVAAQQPAGRQALRAKDLLKGLSSKERAAFMAGMQLAGGRVVALDLAVLEKSGLSRERMVEIVRAFGLREDGAASAGPAGEKAAVTLGRLFPGVSEKVKAEFFDNMKFLNGSVAAVKSEWPEKAIPAGRLNAILETLLPAAPGDFGSGAENAMKIEACEASAKCCPPAEDTWNSSVYD